jgi:hypothetical protein
MDILMFMWKKEISGNENLKETLITGCDISENNWIVWNISTLCVA